MASIGIHLAALVRRVEEISKRFAQVGDSLARQSQAERQSDRVTGRQEHRQRLAFPYSSENNNLFTDLLFLFASKRPYN